MQRTAAGNWAAVGLGIALVVALVLGVLVALRPGGAQPLAAPAPAPVVHAGPDTGALNPAQPLTVTVQDGSARSVQVTDTRTGRAVEGNLGAGGHTWTSTGALAYATTYRVAVDTEATDGASGHSETTVTTVAPSAQAYPSFIPPPSTSSVGVGQPVVVRFDHAVHDRAAAERALSVTSTPAQPGAWYWLSDTEVHYRPQQYWRPGTTVTVKANLFGAELGDGVYGSTNRTETFTVHDAWVAKADGATDQMQIFDNGKLVKTMNISLGAPGFPSHVGPHVISDKQPSIVMDSCTYGVCQGQPGYYREKVDLDLRISNDGEFVHSAPWSVGQQGSENVSHGCVNLAPADAQWFFDHFNIGDVVEITNSGGPALPLSDTYGDWELSWAQWQKGSAL